MPALLLVGAQTGATRWASQDLITALKRIAGSHEKGRNQPSDLADVADLALRGHRDFLGNPIKMMRETHSRLQTHDQDFRWFFYQLEWHHFLLHNSGLQLVVLVPTLVPPFQGRQLPHWEATLKHLKLQHFPTLTPLIRANAWCLAPDVSAIGMVSMIEKLAFVPPNQCTNGRAVAWRTNSQDCCGRYPNLFMKFAQIRDGDMTFLRPCLSVYS